MSAFLGFQSLLMPLGSTNQQVLDQLRSSLVSYGWQCNRKSIYPIATLGTMLTVANAFDMVSTTTAYSNAALPLWLGFQVASPFTPTVMYLQIGSYKTFGAVNFTLDYSDNGSSWTTLQTWNGEPECYKTYEKRKYIVTGASAHAYWRINVTARMSGSYIEFSEFILEDTSGNQVTNAGFIDVYPPSYETIGNEWSKEYIRIFANSTTITFRSIQELLQPMSQLHAFIYSVAGAVTSSITINGVTVSYVGSAPNTTTINTRGLYEACKNSTDANFLAYDWTWVNFEMHFYATKKTPTLTPFPTMTVSNITYYIKGAYSAAMIQGFPFNYTGSLSLTIDLINGFIYYLQVNARGIALATKTNAGYSSPIHCCYGDNASAIAQTPISILPAQPCTPIELIIGFDDSINNTGAFGRLSHWWVASSGGNTTISDNGVGGYGFNVWSGNIFLGYPCDVTGEAANGLPSSAAVMRAEGIFSGSDSGTAFKIHRLVCDPDNIYTNVLNGISARGFGPVYNNLDWYRITGVLTDEQLVLIPGTDFITTINSVVLVTDVTINVVSTTGFLSTGYIVIEDEIIQYTGITGTSFTGCTRGKYATQATGHFINDKVNIGTWMVKIGTGLLLAGYTKPV